MLDVFARDKIQIEGVILKTLATHDRGHSGDLIRNVENVSVLVHEQPEVDITTRPFDWESFNLYPGTLQSAWDALRERAAALDIPWMMKYLIADSTAEEGSESDNSRETLYTWELMKDPSQIRTAARIACHPQLATYDEQLGFRLLLNADETSNGWQSKLINKEGDDDRGDTKGKKKGGKKPPTLGKQGSYVEHITGLMCAYDWSVRRELAWIARRVEQALELPDSSLDEAIRLAIACHDIGKLGREWQRWAREWQKLLVQTHGVVYTIQSGREFLAKTDRLPHKEEKVLRKQLQKPKPPTHACAGVIASLPLIGQRLQACFGDPDRLSPEQQKAGEALLHATLGAIAHHHTPLAKEYDLISWDPAAAAVVQKALKACRLDDRTDGLALQPLSSGEIGDHLLPAPERDDRLATLLAFILVRALRLCDQRAERAWGQAPIFR
jgi:CRISPR-associated endonuclease/helicase Cas3